MLSITPAIITCKKKRRDIEKQFSTTGLFFGLNTDYSLVDDKSNLWDESQKKKKIQMFETFYFYALKNTVQCETQQFSLVSMCYQLLWGHMCNFTVSTGDF